MPYDEHNVFDDEAIESSLVFVPEYRFTLNDISIPVSIKIFRNLDRNWFEFEQSHYIHTPTQAGPYITSRPWNDDEMSALHQAVSGIIQYYNSAVKEGHPPSDGWLKKNEVFC